MSLINVDKIDPQSGTALEVGSSGDTVTVPTGAGLTVTDEVKTNKITPATGVAFTLGDSGDTFTVPSGATLANLGTATGFPSYDDNAVINDISTLALHQATNNNSAKYNLVNSNVDVYQDSSAIANLTNVVRDTSGEYISSVYSVTNSDFVFALDLSSTAANPPALSTGSTISIDANGGGLVSETRAGSLDTYALRYENATDDWFRFPDSATVNLSGDFSWDWQIYFHSTATSDRILSKVASDGSTYEYYSRPQCMMYVDGRGSVAGQSVSLDQWYYVCLEAYGGNLNGYLDGTRVSQTSLASATSTDTSAPLYIGGAWKGTTSYGTQFPNVSFGGMRYQKGSARYDGAASITIPTTPLTNQNTTVNATGSYESTAQTANASVTTISGVVTYTNATGTATLNTDIVLEVSADNGSTWQSAALTAGGTFSTGVLQAVTNDITVAAGTQIKYKMSFANQAVAKETRINGISLSY